MTKAIWNGVTLAASDDTVIVEGNHYFPADEQKEVLAVVGEVEFECLFLCHQCIKLTGSARTMDAAPVASAAAMSASLAACDLPCSRLFSAECAAGRQ